MTAGTWIVNKQNQKVIHSSKLVGKLHTKGLSNEGVAAEMMRHEKISEGEPYYGKKHDQFLEFVNKYFNQPNVEVWYYDDIQFLSGTAGFVILTGNVAHGIYPTMMS